ncbi:MAG: acyl-CoA dehydrogenase [Myxococcales bacterium]|nr:acyl-CoA dehydrogenase [Myxococcales bacterium]
MHHYKSNLRDLYFNLFEVLEVGEKTLGRGRFDAMDEASARELLRALEKVCANEIASSFAAADLDPPYLDAEGVVRVPDALKRSIEAHHEGGWHLLEVPQHLGGAGAPPSVVWAAFEMVVGANPAAAFYLFGSFIARVIDRLGTPSQRARFLPQMLDQRWAAAMVLTEPDAGSDVGAARASARHIEGDEWAITGEKRFITNGDFEIAGNVVHLVLARPEGAAGGTKGLSMFIVPKYWVERDGSLGARNGWQVTKVEKKMGLKASVTCEVSYGGDAPCRGLLVGEVHDGIRQMFHVIEHARMAVGMKSISTVSTAYLNALQYAKERVQGPALARANDKSSPRVRIIAHADVRRMLMNLKCHAEGMRALGLYIASLQDAIELAGGHGKAPELDRLNDLLLPLVKGYCSDRGWDLLSQALQVYGGAGYCQDYPLEQYIRDQKIDTLYEGTTHIQALDLFFRKVGRDGGATLNALLGQVNETLESAAGGEALAHERALLAKAVGNLQAIFMTMLGKLEESVEHVGLQGNRILHALAEVVLGWLLIRHAAVALAKRDGAGEADRNFYDGKVASARWYCREVLPNLAHLRKLIEASELSLVSLDEALF